MRIFLASFVAIITLMAFGLNLLFIATNPLGLCGHRFVRLSFLLMGFLAACAMAVLGGAAFGFGIGISDYCVAPTDNFEQFVPAANVAYINNFLKSSGNNSVLGMFFFCKFLRMFLCSLLVTCQKSRRLVMCLPRMKVSQYSCYIEKYVHAIL